MSDSEHYYSENYNFVSFSVPSDYNYENCNFISRSFSAASGFVTKFRSRLGDGTLDDLCVLRGIFMAEKKERLRKLKEQEEKKKRA